MNANSIIFDMDGVLINSGDTWQYVAGGGKDLSFPAF